MSKPFPTAAVVGVRVQIKDKCFGCQFLRYIFLLQNWCYAIFLNERAYL